MKYSVENQTTNYGDNRVSFAADFVIYDDADVELWRKGFTVAENLTTAAWYNKMKAKTLAICQGIKDRYVTQMTKILTDTGQPDRAAIVNDITDNITGGIK